MAGSTVCSMCGDVGFYDKLFRCGRCRRRFQHSYCTNYYVDAAPAEAGVCDWCLSSDDAVVGGGKQTQQNTPTSGRCGNKQQQQQASSSEGGSEQQPFFRPSTGRFGKGAAGKVTGGVQEGGRRARSRYKLLKDVLC